MTEGAARTVGELLAEADALSRQVILNTGGDQAQAMVRTWGEVVEAAAALWARLPASPSTPGAKARPGADPMARLEAMTRSLHRSTIGGQWPGPGPGEDRLGQLADLFTHATGLAERNWDVTAGSPPPSSKT